MQKIVVFNQNNQTLEIEIIRYFKKDDKKYLIFTLGETDEQDYVKVYVSKILGLNGTLAAYDIIDEIEWANVRELVKRIIKSNRDGALLEIEDLSTDLLTNIKINGQQGFKLISSSINLLGSNINEVQDEIEDKIETIEPPSIEIQTEMDSPSEKPEEQSTNEEIKIDVDYLKKYQELIEENSMLKTKLAAVKAIIEE